MPETPSETDGMQLTTRFDADVGRFVVAMEIGSDIQVLDRPTALRWAEEVMAAVACAEHDATVAAQLRATTMPNEGVVMFLADLRNARPQLTPTFANLYLVPGVSAFDDTPFMMIMHRGKRIGQWNSDDARQHANDVLEIVRGADLDTAYLKKLMDVVEFSLIDALRIIHDLSNYRPKENLR